MSEERMHKLFSLNTVFTPATPIEKKQFFAGRIEQIRDVLDAAMEPGRHAVIFGERGVGKTSLANIISEELPDSLVLRVSTDSTTHYNTLWRKIFRRIIFSSEQKKGLGFVADNGGKEVFPISELLPKDETITIDDVILIFEKFNISILLIIDEFDRLSDTQTKTLIADTLKSFSDTGEPITVVLVGVANTVTELIGEHPSIERNIKQIKLHRMTKKELAQIIDNGIEILEMEIDENVKTKITSLSQGFPHFTHLLSKYSAKEAIDEDRNLINEVDLKLAIEKAVDDTQESIRKKYQIATIASKKETLFPYVLLSAAIIETDEFNSFRASDLVKPMRELTKRPEIELPFFTYHIGKLSSDERGNVFEKIGVAQRHRYRFSNPLMKPFIIMRGYSDGIIDGETLFELI